MNAPAAGDWVIGVLSLEGRRLRERFPEARLFSSSINSVRGHSLRGRVFITPTALQRVDVDRLREMLILCAMAHRGDPTIQVLP